MATRTLTLCDGCSQPVVGRGIAVSLEIPDAPGEGWTVLTQREIDVHGWPCLRTWTEREASVAALNGNGHAP